MKKQYWLVLLILITGICLSTNNNNTLIACEKKAAACMIIPKSGVKNIPAGFGEEAEIPFDMFMNPLIN